MSDDLRLRLQRHQQTLRLAAAGTVHADNAHHLPKVVIALLRRVPVTAIELDLADVSGADAVGVAAIVVCGRETVRRSIAFAVTASSPAVREALLRHGAGHLLPDTRHTPRLGPPHTGTVCRFRTRPAGPQPAGGTP